MVFHDDSSKDLPHGVERAAINTYVPLENGERKRNLDLNGSADDSKKDKSVISGQSGKPSKLRRLSMKVRTKLHLKDGNGRDLQPEELMPKASPEAPILAPEPPQDDQDARFSETAPEESSALPFKEFVTAPLDTVKSTIHKKGGKEFAENLADADASHGASVKLVRAHEYIATSTEDATREKAVEDFETLKKVRQDAFVRWTMARHVRKVKTVQLQEPRRARKDFVRNGDGKETMDWMDYGHHLAEFYLQKHGGRYIGASSELPEPTQEALVSSFERVLLTSIPVQNFVMELGRIALWDRPMETGAYAVLYFALCVFNFVTRAVILFFMYTALMARYYPPTIPNLREKLERSEDSERTAQDLLELIEQHGTRGWVDAMIQKSGPTMQLQLEDLADFMEILKNFHEWRDPRRTARTLIILFFLWIMISITPVWLLVKEFFFAIGFAFFVFVPIANRWPHYRWVGSPMTWLFWKIPTHGEWAVARLQAEAIEGLSESSDAEVRVGVDGLMSVEEPFRGPAGSNHGEQSEAATSEKTEGKRKIISIGRYHCICEGSHGILHLDTEGVHFVTQVTRTRKWRLRYSELKSMQKQAGSSTMKHGGDLLFVDLEEHEYRLSGLKSRDEAFTQIIGYSGVDWQIIG